MSSAVFVVFAVIVVVPAGVSVNVPESSRYDVEASWLCGESKVRVVPFIVPCRMSWPFAELVSP